MNKSLNSFLKILFTFFLAILVGAIFILAIGENPIDAYLALLKGALGTKLGRGNGGGLSETSSQLPGMSRGTAYYAHGLSWITQS